MQKFLLCILILSIGILIPVNRKVQISKVNFGKTLYFGEVSIVFEKVISDSRCPKNVTCVWAGEAKVLVAISIKGKLIERKELIFYPSRVVDEKANIIYKSEDFQISGIGLFPYPETSNKIANKEYCLEIKVD